MTSGDKDNILSKWVLRALVSRVLHLFVILTLSTVLMLLVLLYSIPSIDFSDIFEFSLIFLNLITIYALITISWLLYKIERKRDKNRANIEQKHEWQSIVNQLHELVNVVDEEIKGAYLPSQSSALGFFILCYYSENRFFNNFETEMLKTKIFEK